MMNIKNDLLVVTYGSNLTKNICERCGVSNLLVKPSRGRKQRLCPSCTHLKFAESGSEIIIEAGYESIILKTNRGNIL